MTSWIESPAYQQASWLSVTGKSIVCSTPVNGLLRVIFMFSSYIGVAWPTPTVSHGFVAKLRRSVARNLHRTRHASSVSVSPIHLSLGNVTLLTGLGSPSLA